MNSTRIDKWLWSVRITKTRSLAAQLCRQGKVLIEGKKVKPSFLISPNKTIEYTKLKRTFLNKSTAIIDKRVSATEAAKCYEDITTPEMLAANTTIDAHHRGLGVTRQKGSGRPTKKERRLVQKFFKK